MKDSERIIRDKCQMCNDLLADIEMGIAEEKDFEKERNGLFKLIIRLVEENPRENGLLNAMPCVLAVAKVITRKDKAMIAKKEQLCNEAVERLGLKDVHGAKLCLDRAEEMHRYLNRPKYLYEIWHGSDRKDYVTRLES